MAQDERRPVRRVTDFYDADTGYYVDPQGEDQKVRTMGVNAIERKVKTGPNQYVPVPEARPGIERTKQLAPPNSYEVQPAGRDPFGRTVGRIVNPETGQDLAATQVAEGVVSPRVFQNEPAQYQQDQLVYRANRAAENSLGYTAPQYSQLVGPQDKGTPERTLLQEAGEGFRRGVNTAQAGLYGAASALGSALGKDKNGIANKLQQFGDRGYIRNTEEAAQHAGSYTLAEAKDKGFGALMKWGFSVLGEAGPSSLEMLATGAVGAATGGFGALGIQAIKQGVKRSAIRAIRKKLLQKGRDRVVATQLAEGIVERMPKYAAQNMGNAVLQGAKLGSQAGAFAGSAAMQGGQVYMDALLEYGSDNPGAAAAAGALMGALDFIGLTGAIKSFLPTEGVARSFMQNIIQQTGLGIVREGATEGAQELVSIIATEAQNPEVKNAEDLYARVTDKENLWRITEAAAAGAVFGGAFGAAGGVSQTLGQRDPRTAPVAGDATAGSEGVAGEAVGTPPPVPPGPVDVAQQVDGQGRVDQEPGEPQAGESEPPPSVSDAPTQGAGEVVAGEVQQGQESYGQTQPQDTKGQRSESQELPPPVNPDVNSDVNSDVSDAPSGSPASTAPRRIVEGAPAPKIPSRTRTPITPPKLFGESEEGKAPPAPQQTPVGDTTGTTARTIRGLTQQAKQVEQVEQSKGTISPTPTAVNEKVNKSATKPLDAQAPPPELSARPEPHEFQRSTFVRPKGAPAPTKVSQAITQTEQAKRQAPNVTPATLKPSTHKNAGQAQDLVTKLAKRSQLGEVVVTEGGTAEGSAEVLADGSKHIALSQQTLDNLSGSEAQRAEAVAGITRAIDQHVSWERFTKAPKAVQDKLQQAFDGQGKGDSAITEKYVSGMKEWMVDNGARWVQSEKAPATATEKFFKNLGGTLQGTYEENISAGDVAQAESRLKALERRRLDLINATGGGVQKDALIDKIDDEIAYIRRTGKLPAEKTKQGVVEQPLTEGEVTAFAKEVISEANKPEKFSVPNGPAPKPVEGSATEAELAEDAKLKSALERRTRPGSAPTTSEQETPEQIRQRYGVNGSKIQKGGRYPVLTLQEVQARKVQPPVSPPGTSLLAQDETDAAQIMRLVKATMQTGQKLTTETVRNALRLGAKSLKGGVGRVKAAIAKLQELGAVDESLQATKLLFQTAAATDNELTKDQQVDRLVSIWGKNKRIASLLSVANQVAEKDGLTLSKAEREQIGSLMQPWIDELEFVVPLILNREAGVPWDDMVALNEVSERLKYGETGDTFISGVNQQVLDTYAPGYGKDIEREVVIRRGFSHDKGGAVKKPFGYVLRKDAKGVDADRVRKILNDLETNTKAKGKGPKSANWMKLDHINPDFLDPAFVRSIEALKLTHAQVGIDLGDLYLEYDPHKKGYYIIETVIKGDGNKDAWVWNKRVGEWTTKDVLMADYIETAHRRAVGGEERVNGKTVKRKGIDPESKDYQEQVIEFSRFDTQTGEFTGTYKIHAEELRKLGTDYLEITDPHDAMEQTIDMLLSGEAQHIYALEGDRQKFEGKVIKSKKNPDGSWDKVYYKDRTAQRRKSTGLSIRLGKLQRLRTAIDDLTSMVQNAKTKGDLFQSLTKELDATKGKLATTENEFKRRRGKPREKAGRERDKLQARFKAQTSLVTKLAKGWGGLGQIEKELVKFAEQMDERISKLGEALVKTSTRVKDTRSILETNFTTEEQLDLATNETLQEELAVELDEWDDKIVEGTRPLDEGVKSQIDAQDTKRREIQYERVTASVGVPAQAKTLVADFLNQFGINKLNARIYSDEDFNDMLSAAGISEEREVELRQRIVDGEKAAVVYQGDTVFLYLNTEGFADLEVGDKLPGELKTRLGHELGHVIYKRYVEAEKAKNTPAWQKLTRAFEASQDGHLSMEEWLADEVGAYVASGRNPQNIKDTFFKKVADAIKRFVKWLTGKADRATVVAYLDGIAVRQLELTRLEIEDLLLQVPTISGYDSEMFREAFQGSQADPQVVLPLQQKLEDLRAAEAAAKTQGQKSVINKQIAETSAELQQLVSPTRPLPASGVDYFGGQLLQSLQVRSRIIHALTSIQAPFKYLADKLLKTSDSWLRTQYNDKGEKIRAFETLAWLTRQVPGLVRGEGLTASGTVGLHDSLGAFTVELGDEALFDSIRRREANFSSSASAVGWGKVVDEIDKLPEAERKQILEILQDERDSDHPLVKRLRVQHDSFHRNYLKHRIKDLGYLQNHYPRIYEVSKVAANRDKFKDLLMRDIGMSAIGAEAIADAIIKGNGFVDIENIQRSLPSGALNAKARKLEFSDEGKKGLREFLPEDIRSVLYTYTHEMVKRAEFESRFGGKDPKGNWIPNGKLERIIDAAAKEGASQDQINHVRQVLEGYQGRLGANIHPGVRRAMSWVQAFQNVRLLPLAVLSSLVDLANPIIRNNGDLRAAGKGFMDALRAYKDEGNSLWKMAQVHGLVHHQLEGGIAAERINTPFLDSQVQKFNERFFRAIGLQQYTNFSRLYGSAVGLEFIKKHAKQAKSGDAQSARYLEELGVTAKDVATWQAQGEPVYGVDTNASTEAYKVQLAVNQFVQQSVFLPDATQRPTWASDPHWMLVWHLKQFAYSFYEVIGSRIVREVVKNPSIKGKVLAALPLLSMFPLAMLGMGLRDILKYELAPWREGKPEWKDEDPLEYATAVIARSGIFGPMQLYFDAERSQEHGSSLLFSLLGPTASHVETLLRDGTSLDDVPLLSIFPEERNLVRRMMD